MSTSSYGARQKHRLPALLLFGFSFAALSLTAPFATGSALASDNLGENPSAVGQSPSNQGAGDAAPPMTPGYAEVQKEFTQTPEGAVSHAQVGPDAAHGLSSNLQTTESGAYSTVKGGGMVAPGGSYALELRNQMTTPTRRLTVDQRRMLHKEGTSQEGREDKLSLSENAQGANAVRHVEAMQSDETGQGVIDRWQDWSLAAEKQGGRLTMHNRQLASQLLPTQQRTLLQRQAFGMDRDREGIQARLHEENLRLEGRTAQIAPGSGETLRDTQWRLQQQMHGQAKRGTIRTTSTSPGYQRRLAMNLAHSWQTGTGINEDVPQEWSDAIHKTEADTREALRTSDRDQRYHAQGLEKAYYGNDIQEIEGGGVKKTSSVGARRAAAAIANPKQASVLYYSPHAGLMHVPLPVGATAVQRRQSFIHYLRQTINNQLADDITNEKF